MEGLFDAVFKSLGWLISQLLAGRLPKTIPLVVMIATILGVVLAVFQVAGQPGDGLTAWLFRYSLAACLGAGLGFFVGVGLIWLVTWALTPVWDVSGPIESLEVDPQEHIYRVNLTFSNTGYGTAKNLAVRFETGNGHQPVDAVGLGDPATHEAIETSQTHLVQFHWRRDEPLEGIIILSTMRKSGFGSEDKYRLRTYLDRSDPCRAWCDVKPLL